MPDHAGSLPFDLRALEVFLAVCDGGGMVAASRRLGITQPSVSQTVAELETRLGALLFDRGVRPLGLTSSGAVLRQRASMLLAEARQVGPLLHQLGQGRLPFLRVGLVDSLARALTGRLAVFLNEAAVQSSILSGLTASHATALLTRQLDIILGAEDIEELEGLERHLLLEEPYILLCPPGMRCPHSLEDLARLGADQPMVRYSARSRTGQDIERHLRRLRLNFSRHQEFDTPYGVTGAVAAGLGWAISTPLCLAEAALPDSGLQCHPMPGPVLTRRMVLVARRGELGPLPARMAAFCQSILLRAGPATGAAP